MTDIPHISLYGLVTLCNISFIVTPRIGVNYTNKQCHIVSVLSLCSTSRSLTVKLGVPVQVVLQAKHILSPGRQRVCCARNVSPFNVTVNIPTFFRKTNCMTGEPTGKVVLKDRAISNKRGHIERVIGLGKTYKILSHPLNHTKMVLSTDMEISATTRLHMGFYTGNNEMR